MADRILSRTRVAFGVLIAAVVLPLALVSRLQVNNDPEIFFPEGAPVVVLERALREHFPRDEMLVVMFGNERPYSREFLIAFHGVSEQLNAHPLVDRVFGVTTLEHISGHGDAVFVEPLIDPHGLDRQTDRERRDRVVMDRFAPDLLAAQDGTALALLVRPVELHDSRRYVELLDAVDTAVTLAGLESSLRAYAGTVALQVAQLQSMLRDSYVFAPATFLFGLILIGWLFRRLQLVWLSALVMIAVASATVASHVLARQPYTIISAMIPGFMFAVTVALIVHFYNAMYYAAQRGHLGSAQISLALDRVRRPARYTTLTTAAGLASLAFSPVPPIRTFGLTAAVGMLCLYLLVFRLLPALVQPFPVSGSVRGVAMVARLDRLLLRLGVFSARRAGAIVAGFAILMLVCLAAATRVEVETDLYRFFDDRHWLTRGTQQVEGTFSGVAPLEVVFRAGPQDFLAPDVLQSMEQFQQWVEGLPQVDRSLSMVDIIKELNWAFAGEDPTARRIPATRALISQYLITYNGRDLQELVDSQFSTARVPLNLNVHGAREIAGVMRQITSYLGKSGTLLTDWEIAGLGRAFVDEEELLMQGLARSFLLASAMIFLLLTLLWRSWRAGLVCMIPNLAPILLIFAWMGAFSIWLDMATVMIASVALGIAVDDTVHIFYGYRRLSKQGVRPTWAVVRTLRVTGRAITATTLILVGQFMLLILSRFQPTAAFGLLTAVGLLAAYLFDVLLLPAVLVLLSRRAGFSPRAIVIGKE